MCTLSVFCKLQLSDSNSAQYCYDPLLAGTVTVVCNQTNKVISAKVGDLSKDDGNLAAEDLETPGTQLLLSEKGREYPVTLITKPQKKRKADTVRAPPSKRIQEELASSDSEVKLRSQKCIALRPSYARQELGQHVSYSSQQHFSQSISKVFQHLVAGNSTSMFTWTTNLLLSLSTSLLH